MDKTRNAFTILMTDDDADDFFFFKEGLQEIQIDCDLRHLQNGQELMDYLLRREKFLDPLQAPRPDFIFLDLNMPGKNGWDVLGEMRSIPELKYMPVIVYTSSSEEEDVRQCYGLGANSYISKPGDWDQLINLITNVFSYWTRTVRLPG